MKAINKGVDILKRWRKLAIIAVAAVILTGALGTWGVLALRHPVELAFAQTVRVVWRADGERPAMDIALSGTDAAELARLCRGTAWRRVAVPSCGFGAVALVFEGEGRTVTLYPAADGCGTMRLGGADVYYDMGKAERVRLEELLEAYGVTVPFV